MELILEINEKDVHSELIAQKDVRYRLRRAARAVLFWEGKVALLYVAKYRYHTLPGGGIDLGETITEALSRELLEEVGASAEIVTDVGLILEYRDTKELMQVSYVYIAKVIGDLEKPVYTEKERSEGFRLVWIPLNEVVRVLKKDTPENYEGKFIQRRDLAILDKVVGYKL